MECEDADLLQKVVKELVNLGIQPAEPVDFLEETTPETTEPVEEPEETPETESAQDDLEPAEEPETEGADTLTISLPDDLTEEEFTKLQNLVASKASLFKKALGTDDLTIQRSDGKISFPWFHGTDSARAQAYAKLVTALCQMAKKSKRIIAKEHEVLNEKYTFRCFLLRLGFIGQEYKECRKILLENLRGSAMLEFLKREYPAGTRVRLIRMDDSQAPPLGTEGAVTGVDDMGSLLVDWDNGSHLNVIHGVDKVQKLNKEAK